LTLLHKGEGDPFLTTWISSESVVSNQWVQYDFGQVLTLDSAHVWNYTDSRTGDGGFTATGTFGVYSNFGRAIHQLDILISTNNVDWTVWATNAIFPDSSQVNSNTGFDLESTIGQDFNNTQARYVRFKVDNNWKDDVNGYVGLAEVKFYAIPEPSALALVGLGLLTTFVITRRRHGR
jgi:hypothetical protein